MLTGSMQNIILKIKKSLRYKEEYSIQLKKNIFQSFVFRGILD